MEHLLAAIDLGTNTARLLIGDVRPGGGIEPRLLKRHITRLGGGFTREHGISAEARERTTSALLDFAAEIHRHGVVRTRAVATSAVRDAANGRAFCAAVLEKTGIALEVIDGEEEGVLTLRGVLGGLDTHADHLFVFDVGGGSTEYTFAEGENSIYTDSLPLGVVRLTEGKGSPEAMSEKIERELEALKLGLSRRSLLPFPSDTVLVGTAGTATTLAAISLEMQEYDYRKVNNHVLDRGEIERIYRLLLPLSSEDRVRIPGMERGREDLIIAGILVTLKTMGMFDLQQLKVSDFGLLEGVLHSMTL